MKNQPSKNHPSWRGIAKRNPVPQGMDELIIYLLSLARTSTLEYDSFDERYGDFDSDILGNFRILNVALDMVGIPPDNTVEQVDIHGYPDGFFQDDTFCRDWIVDLFEEMIVKKEDYSLFLEVIRNPSEWIPKKWSSGDDLTCYIYGKNS